MLDETAAAPPLDPATTTMPDAAQMEADLLALGGDPPQSASTSVYIADPAVAEQLAAVPAPPPAPEQTVDFGKGVKVPIATVRAFYNPTCTLHCQEGVLVRAGRGSLCFCALKRCRDEVVRQRSVRATARPLPGVSTQVNPRELESVDKLSERAARLDAQIAEKDQAAAGEIAALIAQAETCDGAATLYTLEIRQAEEGLEVLAQRRRDREQELRDIEDAARDMTTALGAARVNEDEIVRQAVALRRQAVVLEGKRDQRTAGMRNARERLGRRIAIKLARAPRLAVEGAPGAVGSTGTAPHEVGPQGPPPDPVVESSSAPLPVRTAEAAAFFREIERENAAATSRPLEVTPVVELLDDGTPLGCAPGPAEEPAA